DAQRAGLEIETVEVGDLELAARRRFEAAGEVDGLPVVEIEAGDGVVRARPMRLFLEREGVARMVEVDDTVAFRVGDVMGKDRGAGAAGTRPGQQAVQVVAEE